MASDSQPRFPNPQLRPPDSVTRLLQHQQETAARTISACFHDPLAGHRAAEELGLHEGMFPTPILGMLWRVIDVLGEQGRPVSEALVIAVLERGGYWHDGPDCRPNRITPHELSRLLWARCSGVGVEGEMAELVRMHRRTEAFRELEGLRQRLLDPADGDVFADLRMLLDSGADGSAKAELVCLRDVRPDAVEWLWPGRIALGKLTLLVGDPGLGKSFLTLDAAARVSRGSPWPDAPGPVNPPGTVVLLSAEDDPADTIRPRLDAAGADVDRIHVLSAVRTPGGTQAGFSLENDLPALERAVEAVGRVKLLVIDPVSAYLGLNVDSHRNADVRCVLAPLAELAARHRAAVVAVSHLNKNAGSQAMYRAMGSLAFVAAARAAWVVARDRDNPARRLLLPLKNNLAREMGGLAFSILDGAVAWEPNPVGIDADAALTRNSEEDDKRGTVLAEAMDWLKSVLADGPVAATEIKKRAASDGIKLRTLDKAKTRLETRAERQGFGKGSRWVWRLPDRTAHDTPQQPDNAQNAHYAHFEPLEDTISTLTTTTTTDDDEERIERVERIDSIDGPTCGLRRHDPNEPPTGPDLAGREVIEL